MSVNQKGDWKDIIATVIPDASILEGAMNVNVFLDTDE